LLPSVGVVKEEVAAAAARYFEAQLLKNTNQFLALEAGKASHTEIC
jgi:hypothetical protein